MGLTQKLGTIPLAILTDASNNVGIGAAPSGSYKLEVTGTAKVSGVLTLSSTISNGTYTYTLPSATGTLALLQSTQTFTGVNTFTGGSLYINSGSTSTAGTLYLGDGSITKAPGSGFTLSSLNITGTSTFNSFIDVVAGSAATPQIKGTGGATGIYFPNGASGTAIGFAYSGARMFETVGITSGVNYLRVTQAIAGSSPSLSAQGTDVNINLTLTPKGSGSVIISSTISNGTYTFTLPNATGTLALTSNLSSYLPLAGGTLTGALSGTSATFTSTITSNNAIGVEKNGSGTFGGGGRFYLYNAATTDGFLMQLNASNNIDYWSVTSNTASASPVITFTRAGAATFSSSVLATGTLKTKNNSSNISYLEFERYSNTQAFSLIEGNGENTTGFLKFYTSDTPRLTILGNGNVGIGVTPAAWASPTAGKVIQIGNCASIFSYNNGTLDLATNTYFDGSDYRYLTSAAAVLVRQNASDGSIVFYNAASGTAGNIVSLNQRMIITSGGGLVIKDTTQANGGYFLQVGGNNGGCLADAKGSSDANYYSTSTTIGYHIYGDQTGGAKFYVVGGGQIYSTSTSISAISDIRHKENIIDIETGLNKILALKPRRFDWKEGKGTEKKNVAGFIAQEVEEIFPDLIDDWKETMGATEYFKSIRMTDLIPTLVKAIQEQQALITSLQDRLTKGGL